MNLVLAALSKSLKAPYAQATAEFIEHCR